MKISAYPETLSPSPSSYVVVALGGQNYRITLLDFLSFSILDRSSGGFFSQDLHNPLNVRWLFGGSGGAPASNSIPATVDHPGIHRLTSDAAANVTFGYADLTVGIGGGGVVNLFSAPRLDAVFRLLTTTDLIVKFGVITDSIVVGTLTNLKYGVYLSIDGAVLTGRCQNGVAPSQLSVTPTSYVLSTNTWYRMSVIVSADLTTAFFYLSDSSGLLLWSDSLVNSNMPAPTQALGSQFCATKTSAGAVDVLDLDLLTLSFSKVLNR